MDQFKLLKRRTTDLFNTIPQSLPSIQSLNLGGTHGHHHHHGKRSGPTMKGTWEKISGLPSVPRSSHSINIVAGNVYIFGGESADARKPVDNDMHVVALPSSGAQADYYTIKAKAASPAESEPESSTVPKPEPAAAPKQESAPAPKAKPAAAAKPASKPATTGDDSGSEESEEESSEEESSEEESSEEEESDEEESDAEEDKGKQHPLSNLPAPRVGHATAALSHFIYLFGGRGGPSMTPLVENGRVWVFDTRTHLWSYLDPVPGTVYPPARSYHVAVATPKPSTFSPRSPTRATTWREWALGTTDIEETGTPQNPVVGNIATHATDTMHGTFIIHGGCLPDGSRASDVWAFDIHSRTWQRLPDAPGPARGGTAMALSRGKLYRFGGFDGKTELGGQLDVLELAVDSFNDATSAGEVSVTAKGGWTSVLQGKEDVGYKESDPAEAPLTEDESEPWPGPRSVSRLEAISVGGGREYLVLMLGEREGSGGGHEKAGKFWDDMWVFQVPAESRSVAGIADTMRKVAGGRSGEGTWMRVEMGPWDDEDDESAEGPGARGWIASAPMGELEENGIVIWGGVDEGNRRLGDGWILRLV